MPSGGLAFTDWTCPGHLNRVPRTYDSICGQGSALAHLTHGSAAYTCSMPRLLFGLGLIVIILVPVIGPLLWLFVGRGRKRAPVGRMPRASAPDDDPEFLRGLDREKKERERIRRLEEELAKLDDPDATDGGKPGQPGAPGATGVDPKKSDPGEGDLPGRRDA